MSEIERRGIKAAFIDIDNTLLSFDKFVEKATAEGFERFGLPNYEPYMADVIHKVNGSFWVRIESGSLTVEQLKKDRWNAIFDALGFKADGVAFEKYFSGALNESAIPEDGAFELLEAIKRCGCVICAASNAPKGQQPHRLELAGMLGYFDFVFASDELGAAKPSNEFYTLAFAQLNAGREKPIAPAECVMIGDSLSSDIAGGRSFGMATCYFTRGRAFADDTVADYIAPTLADVKRLLCE